MDVRELASVCCLTDDAWARFATRAGPFAGERWAALGEERRTAAHGCLAVLDDATPVAAMPWAALDRRPSARYDPAVVLEPLLADATLLPALVAGSRFGFVNPLPTDLGRGSADRHRAVAALVAGLLAKRDERGCVAAWALYVDEDLADELVDAADSALVSLWIDARAVVPIAYDDVDGYLATFPRRRRASVRNEIRRMDVSGLHVERVALDGVVEELAELLVATDEKHGAPTTVEATAGYLDAQARGLGSAATALVARWRGRAIACSILHQDHATLIVRAFGARYDELRSAFEYFNLVVYGPVAAAIEAGLQAVDLGRGSLEGKLRRGAELRPSFGVFGLRGRAHAQLAAAAPTWNAEQHARWSREGRVRTLAAMP